MVYMLIFTNILITGNGYIPTSALREILRELDEQLTEEELDGLIQEIDTDGSGTVDFDGKYIHTLIFTIGIVKDNGLQTSWYTSFASSTCIILYTSPLRRRNRTYSV